MNAADVVALVQALGPSTVVALIWVHYLTRQKRNPASDTLRDILAEMKAFNATMRVVSSVGERTLEQLTEHVIRSEPANDAALETRTDVKKLLDRGRRRDD